EDERPEHDERHLDRRERDLRPAVPRAHDGAEDGRAGGDRDERVPRDRHEIAVFLAVLGDLLRCAQEAVDERDGDHSPLVRMGSEIHQTRSASTEAKTRKAGIATALKTRVRSGASLICAPISRANDRTASAPARSRTPKPMIVTVIASSTVTANIAAA